jgi:hypothetical protein
MGNPRLNEAMIEVLQLMRGEIDDLPGLAAFHPGDSVYDEAIELAKDKVFEAIEDIITYIETDDAEDEAEGEGEAE